jgi:glyoxylase-like metal-dependent hydrolase (beta-lactamase superfamily II)
MDLPVAERWWNVEPTAGGITLLWEPHLDRFVWSNVWHVRGSDRDLVVDTGNGVGPLRPAIEQLAEGRPIVAIATHEHFDHIGGLSEFDERLVHGADAAGVEDPWRVSILRKDFPSGFAEEIVEYGYPVPECLTSAVPFEGFDVEGWRTPSAVPTRLVEAGDLIELGDRELRVVHLPGHTSGSIGLIEERTGFLFTGDTAYVDDPLMADDEEAFGRSLEGLRELPVSTVFAGHGPIFDRERLLELVETELRSRES